MIKRREVRRAREFFREFSEQYHAIEFTLKIFIAPSTISLFALFYISCISVLFFLYTFVSPDEHNDRTMKKRAINMQTINIQFEDGCVKYFICKKLKGIYKICLYKADFCK